MYDCHRIAVRLNDRAITVRPENCICLNFPALPQRSNGFVACEHPPPAAPLTVLLCCIVLCVPMAVAVVAVAV